METKLDAQNYTNNFKFVHKYGEAVTELITADKGSFVVDVGCGNGALTKVLCDKGYDVVGIDSNAQMLEKASSLYPDINFMLCDATEFAPILEKHGFRVEFATLFDRPTAQIGYNGLENWINMFCDKAFENVDKDTKNNIIKNAVELCKPSLFKDGTWYVYYVRLRMKAVKI